MTNKNMLMIVGAVIALAVIGLLIFFLGRGRQTAPSPALTGQTPGTQSLGAQIFEQAQNPIKDKLPSTNPIESANPIQGIYQNPFE